MALLETKLSEMVRKKQANASEKEQPWVDASQMLHSLETRDEERGVGWSVQDSGAQLLQRHQLVKALEDYDRVLRMKFDELKLKIDADLNLQAQLSIKMMDEFRARLGLSEKAASD